MGSKRTPLTLDDQAITGSNILTPLNLAPGDIPLDQIIDNPANPSHRVARLAGDDPLVTSIREYGVIQPILVTPATGGKHLLLAGHRRVAAARLAGLTTIPAITRTDLTAIDSTPIMLAENGIRLDLTPIEEATAYQRLISQGLSQKRIAAIAGKSQGSVSQRLALLDLHEDVQRLIQTGGISAWDAYQHRDASLDTQAKAADLFRQTSHPSWEGCIVDATRILRKDHLTQIAQKLAAEAGIAYASKPPAWSPTDIVSSLNSDTATVADLAGATSISVSEWSDMLVITKPAPNAATIQQRKQTEAAESRRRKKEAATATDRRRPYVQALLNHCTTDRWTRLAEAYLTDSAGTEDYLYDNPAIGTLGWDYQKISDLRHQARQDPSSRRHATWTLMVLGVESDLARSMNATPAGQTLYQVYRDLLTEEGWTPAPIEDTLLGNPAINDASDNPCPGHAAEDSGPGHDHDSIGTIVYCDGSCQTE